MRSPQILGGMGLAVLIAIVAVVFVALQSNEAATRVTPPAQSVPDASAQPRFNATQDVLPPTVYIVTYEEAAETMRRAIVEGDNIRVNMGLAPSTDSVAVVANEAEAAQLEASINEGNTILAGLGKPPIVVVRPSIEASSPGSLSTSLTVEEIIAEHDNAIGAVLDQR